VHQQRAVHAGRSEFLTDGTPLTRNGCSYCGFCSSHGCPIDAKGDTRVTALALALRTGRCTILADSHAIRVELKNGVASRVIYLDDDGAMQAVEADRFVLAASTVTRRDWSSFGAAD